MLKHVIPAVLLLVCSVSSARAINWEGHDDWLQNLSPTLEFKRNFDHRVAPLPEVGPPKPCQPRDTVGRVPVNPYEAVPMLCAERQRVR